PSPPLGRAAGPTTPGSRTSITSTLRTAVSWPLSPPWQRAPRILSEQLAPLPEPLACLLRPGAEAPPALVAAASARALLDLAPLAASRAAWPPWLAPHQVPAAERLVAIMRRYGGALLADAVGLGKSYVALAVALALGEPVALVVPAVLAPQWRELLARHDADAAILTHESLSRPSSPALHRLSPPCLYVVDEAHRFRNPHTNRYRTLARLVVGARVLLVTATPVHNRIADLFHLFHLFLRDHDLTALGVASLRRAARGALDGDTLANVAARLIVARSRGRVQAAYAAGPMALMFPDRGRSEIVRAGPLPDDELAGVIAAIQRLEPPGGPAALFRLVLLSRLASSLPAVRASVRRYEAFLDLARDAGAEGRALTRRDFQRWFPRADGEDLQLALLPLLLERGPGLALEQDRDVVQSLRDLAGRAPDPKAALLERLLSGRAGKTIVFVQPRATVRYLPRTPARLAQRVGRVDRLGSPHARVETVTFLPPEELERALAVERRLATKLGVQIAGGAAQLESVAGPAATQGRLDWCDRLQRLHSGVTLTAAGVVAAVPADASAAVLVVRIGSLVEALVVTDDAVRADPDDATRLLERAARGEAVAVERARLARAIQRAAPFVRTRLAALADVRWRA